MLWWKLRQLRSSDPETRAGTARELGEARERKAVPALIESLGDSEAAVRIAAAAALGAISHPAASEPLCSALAALRSRSKKGAPAEHAPAAEGDALARALGAIGKEALPALLRICGSESAETRRWACTALGLLHAPQAVPALLSRLDDDRSEVRKAAAIALGRSGEGGAEAGLVAALGHRDPETREGAAEALGELRAPGSLEALARALSDQAETVQLAAVAGLAGIGGIRAARALGSAAESARRKVREAASAALGSMRLVASTPAERAVLAVARGDFAAAAREGGDAVEPLATALQSKIPERRRGAAAALGATTSAEAVDPLLHALKDPEAGVRNAVMRSLASLGPAAAPGLIRSLAAPDAGVQRLAAEALCLAPDPRALPDLIRLVRENRRVTRDYPDPAEAVRAAASALEQLVETAWEAFPSEDRRTISQLPDCVLFDAATGGQNVLVDLAPLRRAAEAASGRARPARPSLEGAG